MARAWVQIGIALMLALLIWVLIPAESEPESSQKVEWERRSSISAPAFAKNESIPAVPAAEPSMQEADVKTKQRYYDGLVVQPPLLLLSRFLQSSGGDETTRSILLQAFTTSLANNSRDSSLKGQFAEVLLSPEHSLETKAMLAEALADSASLAGVVALLQAAEDPSISLELRSVLTEAISIVGGKRRDDGSFPTDLSPPLEAAFLRASLNSQANPELVSATGRAIAQVGTENGVRILLQKIPAQPELGETIARVRNPTAIPALLEPLRVASDYGEPRLQAAGAALVHIGGDAAVRPLLEWLRNAPPQAQPLAAEWFANIREPVSQELVVSYLRTQTFRSDAIKATLESAYEANIPERMD